MEVNTVSVGEQGAQGRLEVSCQGIGWLVRSGLEGGGKLHEGRTALVGDSRLVADGLQDAEHELVDNLGVGQHVCVVLADAAHHPADGLSDFPVLVFEHL